MMRHGARSFLVGVLVLLLTQGVAFAQEPSKSPSDDQTVTAEDLDPQEAEGTEEEAPERTQSDEESTSGIQTPLNLEQYGGPLGPIIEAGRVRISVGSGTVLTLPEPVVRFAVGDEAIVKVHIVSEKEVLLQGRAPGQSTVFVWFEDGMRYRYDLLVQPNIQSLTSVLQQMDPAIRVSASPDGSSVILRGVVANEKIAAQARTIAGTVAGRSTKVVDMLEYPTSSSDLRLGAVLSAVDPRIEVHRVQVGAEPNNAADSIVLIGRVKDIASLERAITLADLQLGGPGGKIEPTQDNPMNNQRTRGVVGGSGGLQSLGGGSSAKPGLSSHVARGLVLKSASGRVLSFLEVDEIPQILVSIRVLEVNRTKMRDLGIDYRFDSEHVSIGNYQGVNSLPKAVNPPSVTNLGGAANLVGTFVDNTFSISAALNLLESEKLARSMAEPNITTLSGEQATVLVGGEVPIPTTSVGNVATVQGFFFQDYGVRLDIRPTLAPSGFVALEISPSIVRPTGSFAVGGVPGFEVQTVQTTARVAPGQSLVVGGLLSYSEGTTLRGVPVLSRVPILGRFFSSEGRDREEKELLFVITPRILNERSLEETAVAEMDATQIEPLPSEPIELPSMRWSEEQDSLYEHNDAGRLDRFGLPPSFSVACRDLGPLPLLTPSDGTTGVEGAISLTWQTIDRAVAYDVYVDKANPPTRLIAQDLVYPQLPFAALEANTRYYWMVVAKGDPSCVDPVVRTSPIWSFTTSTTE